MITKSGVFKFHAPNIIVCGSMDSGKRIPVPEIQERSCSHRVRVTNLTHTTEQDGLLIVPVKIQFDDTYQFSEGLENVFVTRFAERSENSEVF